MTQLGQFASFAGRSIASVIDGDGTPENPWKLEYQAEDGSCSSVDVEEASGFYYECVAVLAAGVPAGFNPQGGDLVFFRPCEAKFQQFPEPYTEGMHGDVRLILGWITFTLHFGGSVFPDVTPYAVLADPNGAGCYVAAIGPSGPAGAEGSELTKIA